MCVVGVCERAVIRSDEVSQNKCGRFFELKIEVSGKCRRKSWEVQKDEKKNLLGNHKIEECDWSERKDKISCGKKISCVKVQTNLVGSAKRRKN